MDVSNQGGHRATSDEAAALKMGHAEYLNEFTTTLDAGKIGASTYCTAAWKK